MSERQTQRERILSLLRSREGAWVPLPEILDLHISQFGARILELRRSGYEIENRTETVDGIQHSWYRLVSSPASGNPKPETPRPESDYMRRVREERDEAAPLFAEPRQ